MPWWNWQFLLAEVPAPARPDDSLVPVEMDLCLQLVPQLVMLCTTHVSAQQLNLLYSGQ